MIEKPTENEIIALIGKDVFAIWQKIYISIENIYNMDVLWNKGGKAWKYECKFSRGGKTLCALYARESTAGFMIIFGKVERGKVDKIRSELSQKTIQVYDEAKIFHDGKWVMFPLYEEMLQDFIKLLAIKRKPNKV